MQSWGMGPAMFEGPVGPEMDESFVPFEEVSGAYHYFPPSEGVQRPLEMQSPSSRYSPGDVRGMNQWHVGSQQTHSPTSASDGLADWSRSWYHIDPQDLALTAVPRSPLRQAIAVGHQCLAQPPLPSPFSHSDHQADAIYKPSVQQIHRPPPSPGLEAFAIDPSSRAPSIESSFHLAAHQNVPGMPVTPGMACYTDVDQELHHDLRPWHSAYLPSYISQSAPGAAYWSDQDAHSSGSQGTFGPPGAYECPSVGMDRSFSTPVPQTSSPSEESQVTRKRAKRVKREASLRPSISAPQQQLVPVVHSACNSVRIVSGKGEFDFPRNSKTRAPRMFVTIRSNDLGKRASNVGEEEQKNLS